MISKVLVDCDLKQPDKIVYGFPTGYKQDGRSSLPHIRRAALELRSVTTAQPTPHGHDLDH
ncbi:hypothetical protein DSUL_260015 [Desulfovibrionales bacterium]